MSAKTAIVAAPPYFAIRMWAFFAGYFVFSGVSTPFFPVWLQSRGLTEVEIANCVALPGIIRVLLTPLAGLFADRAPHRRVAAITFTLPAAAIFLFAGRAEGYRSILVITGVAFTLWALALPVAEALALTGVRRFGLDYGRMRLGGSVAFIVTNLGSGALLSVLDVGAIFWFMVATLTVAAAVAFALPVTPRAVRALDDRTRPDALHPRKLLAHPAFLALLFVGGLIQASHAVLYSFGSIHWRALGFTGFDIGIFWAIGVACENLLFRQSRAAIRTFGPFGLLVLGGLAAILRWTVYSTDPGFLGFALLQGLHGLTFGATYLGNQHAIARAIPEELTALAQGLFSMISGLLLAGTTFLAGPLYEAFGGRAFLVMTVLPAVALTILAVYRALAAAPPQPHNSGSGG
jgi:MFS transporter, PPP family, 3-phenylpropionic acid transporter